MTKVVQSLVFLEEDSRKDSPEVEFSFKSDLSYGHDHRRPNTQENEEQVIKLLNDTTQARYQDLPTMFETMVYLLRGLKHSQMVKIYYSLTNEHRKKFFQDALPLLKTDAGVTLMKDLIESREVSESLIDRWFSSLAFYKNPTRGMLGVLSSFINKDARNSALLGISSLASTFCTNQHNCREVAELKEIVRRFEGLLGNDCETSSTDEELKMVLVLKGIRNIGHIINSKDTMKKCFKKKSNQIIVRVATIETIRKWELSCSFLNSGLIEVLKDIQEDSEIRINAYLAVMTCPSEKSIETIKNMLINEEVNQVGSFIWTHMSNLQETDSKIGGKLFMKRIIGSDVLQNKWNSDVRKFSRNIEISHFLNEYKIGGTAESNIIFSEKSYIPRSIMLNLTTSLFGENINILEFGGRIEGFDNILEDMFGPDGHFKDDTIHNFLRSFSSRHKREAIDNHETFESEVKTNNPRGNLYMRSFGKDIKYTSFTGIPRQLSKIFKNPLNLFGLTFEDSNLNFEKSSLFLDGSIIIPTVGGLPVNMTALGSSSIQMKSKSSINLQGFLNTGKASLDVDISPSVALKITGLMSVDAFHTKTSIKSTSKLHSSTYVGCSFDIIGSRLVQLQLKIPNDNIELFDVSVDFQKYKDGQYEKIQSYQKQENHDFCTSNTLNTVFGISGCAHLSYYHGRSNGDPDWFFAGPSQASLIFRKTDTFNGLIAKYSWNIDNSRPTRGPINDVSIIYDTPGSNINRKTIFSITFDDKETFCDVDILIPALNFKLGITYDWAFRRKVLSIKVLKDERNVLDFTHSLIKYYDKYEAVSKIIFYDEEILNWITTLHMYQEMYSLEATLKSQLHEDINIEADFLKVKGIGKMKVNGVIKSKNINANITMDTRIDQNVMSVTGDIKYNLFNTYKSTLRVVGKYLRKVEDKKEVKTFTLGFLVTHVKILL